MVRCPSSSAVFAFRAGLVAALLAAGCSFSSLPPDNLAFAPVTDLRRLDGRYCNRGEGEPGEAPLFLAALVFPTQRAARLP